MHYLTSNLSHAPILYYCAIHRFTHPLNLIIKMATSPLALQLGQKRDPVPIFKLCGFNIVLIRSYLHFRCIDWRVKKDKETTGPGYYEKLLKSEVSFFQLDSIF